MNVKSAIKLLSKGGFKNINLLEHILNNNNINLIDYFITLREYLVHNYANDMEKIEIRIENICGEFLYMYVFFFVTNLQFK